MLAEFEDWSNKKINMPKHYLKKNYVELRLTLTLYSDSYLSWTENCSSFFKVMAISRRNTVAISSPTGSAIFVYLASMVIVMIFQYKICFFFLLKNYL